MRARSSAGAGSAKRAKTDGTGEPGNKLSEAERQRVLELANGPEHRNL